MDEEIKHKFTEMIYCFYFVMKLQFQYTLKKSRNPNCKMSRFGIMTCDQTIRFGDLAIYVTRRKSHLPKKIVRKKHENIIMKWFTHDFGKEGQ